MKVRYLPWNNIIDDDSEFVPVQVFSGITAVRFNFVAEAVSCGILDLVGLGGNFIVSVSFLEITVVTPPFSILGSDSKLYLVLGASLVTVKLHSTLTSSISNFIQFDSLSSVTLIYPISKHV